MNNESIFKSSFSTYIKLFIKEKHSLGYKYESESRRLQHFDCYCFTHGNLNKLTQQCIENYLISDSNRSAGTKQNIIGVLRQFAFFLIRNGQDASVYPLETIPKKEKLYRPYIFTHDEIKKLISEAEHIRANNRFPTRHQTLPLIYRTLYCCGVRISEVLNLTIDRVDFSRGILLLSGTKDYRDRVIPLSDEMLERYSDYYSRTHATSSGDTYFFRSDYDKPYSTQAIANNFKQMLWKCGISYGGRKKGPHLHSLRHTFSVHCLQKAMAEGRDLKEFLPILSAYLGHKSLQGTQKYLHLTAELYPDILSKLDEYCGDIIPKAGDFLE